MYAVELLNRGGGMMWVLSGLSMIACVIAVDRVIHLHLRSRLSVSALLGQVLPLVQERRFGEALQACGVSSCHPLPEMLRAGLAKADRRDEEIERTMEEAALRELPRLKRGVSFLGLLGNTATLLGLLGTIFGLIRAFSGVSAASAAARQQVLAEGISIAMYTTAFGLIVAVPILFAHNLISSRLDMVLTESEEGGLALLGAISDARGGNRARPRLDVA